MTGLPDAATLDALVIGADDPDDRAAWEALVRLPGGAEAWRAAVARRRRLDLLAHAVRGRPWLASAVHRLSVLSRRLRTPPALDLGLVFPDASLDALAGATLAAGVERADEVVPPRWGHTVLVRVRLGERVGLSVVLEHPLVHVRYVSQGQEGLLPSGSWRLEPGEAPVLLVAIAGAGAGGSLLDALGQATAVAGLIVLEAPPQDETLA